MDEKVFKKVNTFFGAYPKRSYPKDHILIFAGENPDRVFYLTEGLVTVYDTTYRGDDVVLNIFRPPAFFPMAHALNKDHNRFFYKTSAPTTMHVAPPAEVVAFLQKNPDVALDLLRRLYGGVEGVLNRIVHLMSGTAKSRIIYELLIECRRFGSPAKDGSYLLAIHETDLAARTGLSRETVSRELRLLKQRNVAYSEKQAIRVVDLLKLEQLFGQTI